jgi:hypothetical protein
VKSRLIGLVILAAGVAHADEAVYRMRGPILPGMHAANGYAVGVRDLADGSVEVHVETSLNPIGANGTFAGVESGERPMVPDGFELPSSLRVDLRSEMGAWEAATTVLEWVNDRMSLVDNDRRPQDAVSVIKRGGGRCSGLANATAALLMAAGFEARTVSGLLISGRRAIPHRWVEARLPGAGWVPTDPTLGLWVVTPRHVAFDGAVDRVPEIEIVEQAAGELDRLPRTGTTIIRPNEGAELVCRLDHASDERSVVASLERGSDIRRGILGPEMRFASLLPGRWSLTVRVDGRVVERRELHLKAGVVHSYVVRLPLAAAQEVGL